MFAEYCHSIAIQGRELKVEKLVVTELQSDYFNIFINKSSHRISGQNTLLGLPNLVE